MRDFLEAARGAALQAGEIQRRALGAEHDIRYKGATDLVTEIDRQCEEVVVAALRERFPDHDFLAEENSYESRGSRYRWIIDPLDGTTNYAHGFPWFCVSIALEIEGEIGIGVIYHPMMDELFTAVRGGGAFLNGAPIAVSTRAPLSRSLLATGFPYDKGADGETNFGHFMNFQTHARAVRRAGAAALDLACVAAGRFEGYWESKIKPWDVAAGMLLVREAGGKVTSFSGAPYSIYDHRIVASNGIVHDEMLSLLGIP